MSNRSIKDDEIALIKRMLLKGTRNTDIQFYFNRQDRPVNSGRISQIKSGTYGPEVEIATEESLKIFLSSFEEMEVGVKSSQNEKASPKTLEEQVIDLFDEADDEIYILRNGETSLHECKQDIDPKKLNPVIRAIAALANNNGGFIFFGVENNTFRATGLSSEDFINTDIATIAQKAKSFLMPTPEFTKDLVLLGGQKVGVISVPQSPNRPIIVSRDGDKLEDGTILFRYPGESAKIKGGDLLVLLQERDRIMQSRLLETASKISKIGTEKAIIVDASEGTLDAGNASIVIDQDLADQLEFIREGEFEETDGAPTLRLVGDVRTTDNTGAVRERLLGKALTADIVLASFLRQERVRSAQEYISVSAQVQRLWLPIFYFIHLSGSSVADTIEVFENIDAVYRVSKDRAISRMKNEISAFSPATAKTRPIVARLSCSDFDGIEDEYDDRFIAQAIQSLPNEHIVDPRLLDILDGIFERGSMNSTIKSNVYRAASRLDELLFNSI